MFISSVEVAETLGVLMEIHRQAAPKLAFLLWQGVHGFEKEPQVLEVPGGTAVEQIARLLIKKPAI